MTSQDEENEELDRVRHLLRRGDFNFIDGGCGSGGSLAYCEKTFAGGRGLGFDASPSKIEAARAAGHRAYLADMISLELPERCVSFISFLDVLEHLPDIATTRSILENMASMARDFIFIRHPSFEDIDYLKTFGLKIDWTDWHGHPNMMLLDDFDALFRDLGWTASAVFGQKPIMNSSHVSVVPEDAPRDTVGYDAERHGLKQNIRFDRVMYSQFDIFVRLNRDMSDSEWGQITKTVVSRRNRTKALRSLGR